MSAAALPSVCALIPPLWPASSKELSRLSVSSTPAATITWRRPASTRPTTALSITHPKASNLHLGLKDPAHRTCRLSQSYRLAILQNFRSTVRFSQALRSRRLLLLQLTMRHWGWADSSHTSAPTNLKSPVRGGGAYIASRSKQTSHHCSLSGCSRLTRNNCSKDTPLGCHMGTNSAGSCHMGISTDGHDIFNTPIKLSSFSTLTPTSASYTKPNTAIPGSTCVCSGLSTPPYYPSPSSLATYSPSPSVSSSALPEASANIPQYSLDSQVQTCVSLATPSKSNLQSAARVTSYTPSNTAHSPVVDAICTTSIHNNILPATQTTREPQVPHPQYRRAYGPARTIVERNRLVDKVLQESQDDSLDPAIHAEHRRMALAKVRSSCWKNRAHNFKLTHAYRVEVAHKRQCLARNYVVLGNRGLYICGLGNEKTNLGNKLQITHAYDKNFDMDRNQSTPQEKSITIHAVSDKDARETAFFTINDTLPTDHPALERMFDQAITLVRSTFDEKNIRMELFQDCLDDDFSAELLVDAKSNEVLAVAEFIYSNKYLWLECIAVKNNYRRVGFGKLLMKRMTQIAASRNKTIMLYALDDVVPFYQSLGFEFSNQYTRKSYSHGMFMVLPLAC
ncbi:hypothetical protein BASA62_001363 [Batrachochytrium salamandrivorans]|nr:hypothetical protein BASA62_001363 [Batrachochytrium salamandrivorans]